jgi:protein involved in polysaccharide export with SLBB domain
MDLLQSGRRALPAAAGAFLLALCIAVPACGDDQDLPRLDNSAQQPERVVVTAPRSADSDYKLGPTDKVRVTVYGEEDLSGEFQIDSEGFVRLPLIGQVHAAGQSVFQLEALVENALDDGYLRNARVNIEVTAYRPFYIIGEVTKPGEYAYASNMTLVNAIALAGGYTPKAVESTIFVRHESDAKEHEVAVGQLTRLYPGDVLRVPETTFWSSADVLSPVTSVLAPVASLAYILKP